MPVMDGLTALKEIMNIDKNAKVIMVTAAGQKNKMVDAVKYGATEFLTKPFDANQIIEIIEKSNKYIYISHYSHNTNEVVKIQPRFLFFI